MTLRNVLALFFSLLAGPALTAEAKPVLTIYTYDAFAADYGPGPRLKAGFEANCGCIVAFVATDSSIGALRRAQLEGATGKADIILGIDSSIAGEAMATGLFAANETDLSGISVPNDWQSPVFVPFDFGYFAFVYDKRKVDNPPHSFQELMGRPASFKVVIEDPRASTPGLGLVLWIKAAYGDDAPKVWQMLKPHILTVTREWSDAYNLFLKGEAEMVLSYTTSPAYHLIEEQDSSYAFADFAEGHYVQIEVAGMLKTSAHKALAQQFLTYLVSPAAQAILPTTNWMYPVAPIALPEGFDGGGVPAKKLMLDDKAVAANARAWTDEALAALQ